MSPVPPYTTEPPDRAEQITQSLWTLAQVAAQLEGDDHTLPKALGGLARLLAEALDQVVSDLWEERESCTCGRRPLVVPHRGVAPPGGPGGPSVI